MITRTITRKGVGRGEQVLLLTGATLTLLAQATRMVRGTRGPHQIERLGVLVVAALLVVVLAMCLTKAQRRIPVRGPHDRPPSSRLARLWTGNNIPLPLNGGGVLTVAAAVGLFTLVQSAPPFLESHFPGAFGVVGRALTMGLSPNRGLAWLALAVLVVVFAYVYNFSLIWRPASKDKLSVADIMQRRGEFIPGVRPGEKTDAYLLQIVARITLPSALALAVMVAGVPYVGVRLTEQNILIPVLCLLIIVEMVQRLREAFDAYRAGESYTGLIRHGPLS